MDGPSPECALISVYAPKEANGTVEELVECYLSFDEQVSSFLSNGLTPIIVGARNHGLPKLFIPLFSQVWLRCGKLLFQALQ